MTDSSGPGSPPVVRFAPSPNGFLHLGHAYSALSNYLFARRAGGRFLLRIEDIDTGRARPEFEQAIFEDLAWLGIQWEQPVRRQSMHFAGYSAILDRLDIRGLLYPCFCTRSEIGRTVEGMSDWPRDPDGTPLYPGTCRSLPEYERTARMAAGETYALRLDMRAALAAVSGHLPLTWREFGEGETMQRIEADPAAWGDLVLKRKDIPASYHIAVVADDSHQGITDVIRGTDLYAATSIHRLLQALLELPEPRYRHHALIRDDAGEKLSKSLQSKTLRALRAEGISPETVIANLGFKKLGFNMRTIPD